MRTSPKHPQQLNLHSQDGPVRARPHWKYRLRDADQCEWRQESYMEPYHQLLPAQGSGVHLSASVRRGGFHTTERAPKMHMLIHFREPSPTTSVLPGLTSSS